jgi:hypothetical protein
MSSCLPQYIRACSWFTRRVITGVSGKSSNVQYRNWAVLVGDSAHAMFPASGEGINSGMEDVEMLMRALDDRLPVRGEDLGFVYESIDEEDARRSRFAEQSCGDKGVFEAYRDYRQPDVDALFKIASMLIDGTCIGSLIWVINLYMIV